MEYIDDGKGGRLPIPDAVVAASDSRDLVAKYAAASPADRETIHQQAKAKLGEAVEVPAVVAPSVAPSAPAE